MDASSARLGAVSNALSIAGIAFHRIAAMDARVVPPDELAAYYDPARNRRGYFVPMTEGEIACFLSHRKAWQTFLDSSDAPYAVFLEDDVEPLCSAGVIEEVLDFLNAERLPTLIKLFHPRAIGAGLSKPQCNYSVSRPLVAPLGAVAQAMNRAAAQALLNGTTRLFEPVDVAIQRWWDFGIRVRLVTPGLFDECSIKSGGSTLHKPLSFPARCQREFIRPVFQARRLAQSLIRRSPPD